jgi:hypothetical protein
MVKNFSIMCYNLVSWYYLKDNMFFYILEKKNIICLSLHIAHIQSTFLGDAILHVIYLMKHITSSQIQNIFEKTL